MDLIQEPEENYKLGWIFLFRSIRNHWIWRDERKLKWWIDLLLEVNHSFQKVNIGNEIIDCNRGQSIRSLKGWADRWNISKDTARNFLRLLEKDNMISSESYPKTTRITICNYAIYQPDLHDEQTMTERLPTQTIKKEGKNNNKTNNYKLQIPLEFPENEEFILTKNKKILKGKRLEAFKIFWDKFGYKKGKAEAADSWLDIPILTDKICNKIYIAAESECKVRDELKKNGEIPKMAQGWITARRWEDEILQPEVKIKKAYDLPEK